MILLCVVHQELFVLNISLSYDYTWGLQQDLADHFEIHGLLLQELFQVGLVFSTSSSNEAMYLHRDLL